MSDSADGLWLSPAKEHPMATRLPASQRTREELRALIEGRLSTASGKDELVKLAARLIVEEALEGETADAIGRDYYEHGAQPGQGYRNGYRTVSTGAEVSAIMGVEFSVVDGFGLGR
jgi:Transposase, Mutator family